MAEVEERIQYGHRLPNGRAVRAGSDSDLAHRAKCNAENQLHDAGAVDYKCTLLKRRVLTITMDWEDIPES